MDKLEAARTIRNDCEAPITEVGGIMQLALTFEPRQLARRCDPVTSHMAADRVREFAGGQCAEILDILKRRGPLTPEQIAAHMEIDAYAARKRLPELQRAGLACPTGQTAPTVSGRQQRIWAAA